MKTRSLICLALFSFLLIVPAATADTLEGVLSQFPDRPDWLAAESFQAIASGSYSAELDVPLLGHVDAFVYNLNADPIVALVLPTLPAPFDEVTKAVGIAITDPALFWIKGRGEEVELDVARMPQRLAMLVGDRDRLGMPGRLNAYAGVNVFGKISVGDNSSSPLVTSLAFMNLPPRLFLGLASRGGSSLITMALPIHAQWSNPFQMPNTTLESALVRIERTSVPRPRTQLTAWATARIKGASQTFTMLASHNGTNLESIGLDTQRASLTDVIAIISALGNLVTLPTVPMPPEDVVMLENRNDRIQEYSSSPPDLTKMMFQTTVRENFAELNVNAKGKVFGVTVAAMTLNASPSGVRLEVPADCPFHPIGLDLDLTRSLDTNTFKPTIKDCLTGELMKVAEYTGEFISAAGTVTADAAMKAEALALDAGTQAGTYAAGRATTWAHALAGSSAATQAAAAAQERANSLWSSVVSIEGEIEKLVNKIANMVVGFFSDAVSTKQSLESKRDHKRVAYAAAKDDEAKALTAAAVASPIFNPVLNQVTNDLIAAKTQQQTQERVADYARSLSREVVLQKTMEVMSARRGELSATEMTAERAMKLTPSLVGAAVSTLVEEHTEQVLHETVAGVTTTAFDVPVRIKTANGACLAASSDRGDTRIDDLNAFFVYVNQPCTGGQDEVFTFKADGTVHSHKPEYCLTMYQKTLDADVTRLAWFESKNEAGALPVLASCENASQFFFDPVDGLIRYLYTHRDQSFGRNDKVNDSLCVRLGNRQVGHSFTETRPSALPGCWNKERYSTVEPFKEPFMDPEAEWSTAFHLERDEPAGGVQRAAGEDGGGPGSSLAPLTLPPRPKR